MTYIDTNKPIGKTEWIYESNPIGHPVDPEDTEFEGPRTPPTVSIAIRYTLGDLVLHNAVTINGTWKTLAPSERNEMFRVLNDWLEGKLRELEANE